MDKHIEERIEFLKASVALSDIVGPDELIVTVSDLSALLAKLEAAQKERDGLREKVNQSDTEWQEMADRILAVGKRAEKAENESGLLAVQLEIATERSGINFDRAQKAEAALSAANEKLSKPVLLPDGWRLAPIMPTNAMIDAFRVAYEHDDSYADHWIRMLAAAPRPTGFTVEGE